MTDLQLNTPEQRAVHWHQQIGARVRLTLESAWRCGEALAEVKAARHHGEWLPWLETVGIHERTAQRRIRLFAAYPEGEKTTFVAFGSIDAALRALPDPRQSKALDAIRKLRETLKARAEHLWNCGQALAELQERGEPFPGEIPAEVAEQLIRETATYDLDEFTRRHLEGVDRWTVV